MVFTDCTEVIASYYEIFMKKITNKSREFLKKAIKTHIAKIKKNNNNRIHNNKSHEEKNNSTIESASVLYNNINIKKLFNLHDINDNNEDNNEDEQFLEKLSEEEMQQIIAELNQTRLGEDWISNANKKIGMQKAAIIGKKLLQDVQNAEDSQEIALSNLSSIKHGAKKKHDKKNSLKEIVSKNNRNQFKLSKY